MIKRYPFLSKNHKKLTLIQNQIDYISKTSKKTSKSQTSEDVYCISKKYALFSKVKFPLW